MEMVIDQEKVFEEAIRFGNQLFRKKSFLEFCVSHIRLNVGGHLQAFSLEGHEPLRELYSLPEHPHIVIPKATQLGVSTLGVLRSFYLAYRHSMNIGYYFPTDDDVEDFVQGRVDPIISNSELLEEMLSHGEVDNKNLKQLGDSFIYFRGVFSKRKVKSIDLDHIVKDEVDEADQENLEFAESRLDHSEFGYITELSQPSVTGFGIDASFETSDRSYWGIKCEGCGHWNFPDKSFPECIIVRGKTSYVGCVKCSRKLNKSLGVWVAEHPDRSRDKRGFQLSHLIFDFRSAGEIKRQFDSATSYVKKKNFFISKLGRPYSSSKSAPVTEEILRSAQRGYGLHYNASYSFMGMDVGDICHLVFGHLTEQQGLRVHYFCSLASDREQEIIGLIGRQNILYGVIDAMPYKAFAKRLARHFRGRVAINYYKGEELRSLQEGDVPKSTVNRDESLDDLVEDLASQRVELPGVGFLSSSDLLEYENFKAQLRMLVKEPVEKPWGIEYSYKKRVSNHYGMALNYMRIASQLAPVNVYPSCDPVYF